jgi:Haemin-degrading HemS.ChuX domain
MSPDPFFQPELGGSESTPDDCQARCPKSRPGGFCGACIDPACLRIGEDGSVRVGLSATPEDWFGTLSALGSVLHLTRNRIAVLGQIGPVPTLGDWRNPVLPRDADARLAPNLAEHASLWAVREPSPLGMAYGFEARDASGQAFQRIVLTAPARRELFEQFVTEHQSPADETIGWFSPNTSASQRRCRAIEERAGFLRSCLAAGSTQIRALPLNFVPRVLNAVARARLPIRTTHYTRALVRAVVWTPEVNEANRATDAVEFIHGENVGLHLQPASVAGVWLRQGRCVCCDQEQWTVEITDANDHVGLAITVGDDRNEAYWREILLTI